MTEKTQNTALEVFPLLPLRDIVVFPRMVITLFMGPGEIDPGCGNCDEPG